MELDKLHRELEEYRSKKDEKETKVFDLLTSADNIAKRKTTFDLGGFELNTYSSIPKEVRDRFLDGLEELAKTEDIGGVTTVCAEFLAAICYDEELRDVNVWVEFDNKCGCIQSVAKAVFEELSVSSAELKRVCKH